MTARLAFWMAPNPQPKSTIPATTATPLPVPTSANLPSAATITEGTISFSAPCRSPKRPAHQRLAVAATEWASNAIAARLPDPPGTAAGRNVHAAPAATVVVVNISAGRTSAGLRNPARTPIAADGSDWRYRPGSPPTTESTATATSAPSTNTTT